MVTSSFSRSKVFISYSHKDVRYLKELQIHLAYYKRVGLIEVWDDTRITPGSHWSEDIKEAIKQTKMAILLVSANFLASKFIAENELPPLLAAAQSEGAIIIPVIVSVCAFEDTELAQFQAINGPSKPLAEMKPSQRDKLWTNVVKEIKKPQFTRQIAESSPNRELSLTVEKLQGQEPTTKIGISDPLIQLFDKYDGMLKYKGSPEITYKYILRIVEQNGRKLIARFINNDGPQYDQYYCTGTIMDNNILLKGKRLQDTVEMNLEGLITENREIDAKGTIHVRQFVWHGKNK